MDIKEAFKKIDKLCKKNKYRLVTKFAINDECVWVDDNSNGKVRIWDGKRIYEQTSSLALIEIYGKETGSKHTFGDLDDPELNADLNWIIKQ